MDKRDRKLKNLGIIARFVNRLQEAHFTIEGAILDDSEVAIARKAIDKLIQSIESRRDIPPRPFLAMQGTHLDESVRKHSK